MKTPSSIVFIGKKSTRWEAFFMKKLGKGIIIGTAVVVLGTTAVFASGFGNGPGGQGRASASTSQSAPSWQGDGMYCTDADGDGICDYHQDGSCHYADTDGDGVCDQYQEKVSSGLVSGGHHGAGHHGGWGNCHN